MDPNNEPPDFDSPKVAPTLHTPGLPPDMAETARLLSQLFSERTHPEHIEMELVQAMTRAFRWGYNVGGLAAIDRAEELFRQERRERA